MKRSPAEDGSRPVALGMKSHIGWAAVVALAGPASSAEVVAKRRIDMATTFDEGAVYHKSQELPLDRAEALIRTSTPSYAHATGTCRMGPSPATSVANSGWVNW